MGELRCGVCGEPKHGGTCLNLLKRLVSELRGQAVDNRVDFDFLGRLPVDNKVSTGTIGGQVASTDRKAYKREWMRQKRRQG